MSANQPSDPEGRALARARHIVYNRMAFISAAVWAVGTLLLFINIVPPTITKPVPEIVIAMMVPVVPAALPWLFYPAISRAVARRNLATPDTTRGPRRGLPH
jgi:hypothetical protein